MATTTFRGNVKADSFEGPITGDISGTVTGAVVLPTYTVAGLPAASTNARKIVYVSNGNAGAATVAVSNGSAWLNLVTGTAVSAT